MKKGKNISVVTRFAPSPTGPLHIGGVRTAIYNYLLAKKYNGKFLLRIEDTDSKRFVPESEEYIKNTLDWLGIKYDKSNIIKQSNRKSVYKKYAHELIELGKAYYAFDTPEEIEIAKDNMKLQGYNSISYNYILRDRMNNSLTLSKDEVENKIKNNHPYVIRIKFPKNHEIKFRDEIKGWNKINTNNLDDKILWKSSDNLPTYHLANVIDDHYSQISHVIRGVEWLSSTPLHVYLYKCFNWNLPYFCHLPLINHRGKKLSKREASKYNIPVYILPWKNYDNFKSRGFGNISIFNFLALLGWNPGNNKEIMDINELINLFSLKKISKSAGSEFDIDKALWIQSQHLKNSKLIDLSCAFHSWGINNNISYLKDLSIQKISIIIDLVRDRCTFLKDIWEECNFLFIDPIEYNKENIIKKWGPNFDNFFGDLLKDLETIEDLNFIESVLEKRINIILDKYSIKKGNIYPIIRIAIMGKNAGPPLFRSISLLGKDKIINRIKKFLEINNV